MADERVKHLEFVQAVITRQAGNSFLIKGWSLTVAAAFFGFAAERSSAGVALVALFPTAAFWLLDAYYLRQERLFRCLYENAITDASTVPLFSMDTTPYRTNAPWRVVVWSRPLALLYVAIIVAALALAVIVAS